MWLSRLLVASISSGILASTFLNPRSLSDSILFNLPRSDGGLKWIESFLANFCPVRDAHGALLVLRYPKFPYQKIYELIEESPERRIQLFKNLFSATNENNNHETFFSPRKLQNNPELAKKIFLEVESVVYKGRFFAPGLCFVFSDVYRKDERLAMAMLRLGIIEQMSMVNDLAWLDRFLDVSKEDHAHEIFKLLLDHHEMTPEILSSFMKHWVWAYRKNLIDLYLYPEPTLPREERLMRYALLRSVERPYIYAECKRLEPQNNLVKLRGIATRRRDRQSLSILFYCESENQANLKVSEMLSYVKSGGLSPATTRYFIDWAVRNGVELGDWPLEHLPRNSRRLPKEDRLSAWLCSGALEYKNVDMASFDDLYDRSGDMLINMRFTEPVKTKDGRVITRAAEYFILNAQVILDTYRGDQQQASKAIPIEDCRRILVGILYALAEGQHLDLSNTVLEMREGDETWACFENIAECSDYKNAARNALSYLKSDEIYGHVHRALPRQLGRDEKVVEVSEEMVKGIGQLSIN